MKVDIRRDLSNLTTINETNLNKLVDIMSWCISDAVVKAVLDKDNTVDIDIGIGNLSISISNTSIKYKFMPNQSFEKTVTAAVVNERNLLTLSLEDSLVDKLTNTYKNFF